MTLHPQNFTRWLSRSIAHRVRFYALLLTTTVILLFGAIAYFSLRYTVMQNIQQKLAHESQLVSNTFSLLLNSISNDVNELAFNSFIANGLVDSTGKDIYLTPFLRDHKQPIDVPLNLVLIDFQGAAIAANSPEHLHQYQDRLEITRALQAQIPYAAAFNDPKGAQLLLVKPIIFPPTQQTEGGLVAQFKLDDLFKYGLANLAPDFYAELSVADITLSNREAALDDRSFIKATRMITLPKPFPPIPFELRIGQNKNIAFANLHRLTIAFSTLTPLILLLVFFITGKMAKRLAAPIIRLNKIASYITEAGELNIEVSSDNALDEIGQLTGTFNLMLKNLRLSYTFLEDKVKERTKLLQESEIRFHTMADNSPAMIWTANKNFIFDYHNQQALNFTELTATQLQQNGWLEKIHEEDRKSFASARLNAFQTRKSFRLEYRLQHQREYRTVLENGVPQFSATGEFEGFVGVCVDITDRIWTEEQLRLAASVFEQSSQGIVICNADRRIISVNRGYSHLTGYELDEVLNLNPNVLGSGKHPPEFYQAMWDEINLNGYWQGEIWNKRKNGELFPEWLTINTVRNAHGQTTHYVGMFSDISARKEAEQRIEHLAYHDVLTGLPNRTLFKDRLQQAIVKADRYRHKTALLFIDMDRFKLINDSLGHDAGDELLKGVAARLNESVREQDTVARLGGDEFIVLLEEVLDLDNVIKVAEKILNKLNQPYPICHQPVYSSPSIGISIYPDDGSNGDVLIKNADTAMYQAKAKGRNAFVFYAQGMNADAMQHLEIERDLRMALERNELHVYLQPQINMDTGDIMGAEALLRWKKTEIGFISPARFIPIAESCGLILTIGNWVLNEVCKNLHNRQTQGKPCVPIAVNISAVQFGHQDFFEQVTEILDSYTISTEILEFEITESALMKNADVTAELMHKIRALGIRFTLDDFGTGYSSLSYLRTFPISTLKIDQSFVRDIATDEEDAALTSAIIAMAHSLHLDVIAEGVETIEQERFLKYHHCKIGQGYYYAKPMPMDEFCALLEAQSFKLPQLACG